MKITVLFIFCVAAALAAPRESGETETDPNNKEAGQDFEKLNQTEQENQREGRNENFNPKAEKILGQPDRNEFSGQNSGAGYPGSQNGRSPQSNFGGRGHSAPQGGFQFPTGPEAGQQGNSRNPGQGPKFGQAESGGVGRGQNGRPNSGPGGSQFGQTENNIGGRGQTGRPNSGPGGSQFGQSENNSGGRGQSGRPNPGPGGPQGNGNFGPGRGQPNPGQQGGSQFGTSTVGIGTNSAYTTADPIDKEESTDEPPKTGVTYVGGSGTDGGQTVGQSGGGNQGGASAGNGSSVGGVYGNTTKSPSFFDRLTGAFKNVGK